MGKKKTLKDLLFLNIFLLLFLLIAWLRFPYLFSNGLWRDAERSIVLTYHVYTGYSTEDEFQTIKAVCSSGTSYPLLSLRDFYTEERIVEGEAVYFYPLNDKFCMTRQKIGKNYTLRWKYYWKYDDAFPVNFVLFFLLVGVGIFGFRLLRRM